MKSNIIVTGIVLASSALAGASAVASGCNIQVIEPIRFSAGSTCWNYAGKATHFRGRFAQGQRVTLEMNGEKWNAVGPDPNLSKPSWAARSPEIQGPHNFFAMREDVLAEPTGRLEAVLPEAGQYTFGFSPCSMWNGYGHVSICASAPSPR